MAISLPEVTDPTVMLVHSALHCGQNAIMVILRHHKACADMGMGYTIVLKCTFIHMLH